MGRAVKGPGRWGFYRYVPECLPRKLALDSTTVLALSKADTALGRLAGAGRLLPNPHLLVGPYVTAEAVASSRIEGTQASLSDVFEANATGRSTPGSDVLEVQNYIAAMATGLRQLEDMPLCLRLIRDVHAVLMSGVRGQERRPGELRTSPNWIGSSTDTPEDAAFVPPLPDEMGPLLGDLEQFLNEDAPLPVLVRCALAHYQFETIHPFLDGNGRIGRLLVTLYLCVNGVLRTPSLYLSLYLKTHRADYYRLLQDVREHGAWETWLDFFLTGVADTANQAFDAATRIIDLFKEDRELITTESDRAGSTLRIHDQFQHNPFLMANQLVQQTGLSAPTVNAALADLERFGIVEEITGRKRGRVFSYRRYLAILSEGTDPLPITP